MGAGSSSTESQLSGHHLRLLQILGELAEGQDGARASEMAELLGGTAMSVASTLSHLRDSGYVARAPVRYSALWCLTSEGRRELEAELLLS
jgi:DNA-binding IclR family transcriptional regulator